MIIELLKNIAILQIVLFSFLVTGNATAGNEDRTFERQRLELVEKVEKILINNKICQSKRDCQEKKLAFISPGKSGVNVKTYGFINPVAIQEIIAQCAHYFVESNGALQVDIEVFENTKEAALTEYFWRASKPVMNIHFKGGK